MTARPELRKPEWAVLAWLTSGATFSRQRRDRLGGVRGFFL